MYSHILLGASLVSLAFAGGGPQPATDRCYTQWGSTSHKNKLQTYSKTYYTPCTVTVTTTVTKTSTAKTRVTSTSTKTSTVKTATTVPTPAGFSPIQDTLQDSGYDGADGNPPALLKRDLAPRSPAQIGQKYPDVVTCWHYTHSKCATSTKPATYLAVKSTTKLPTTTVTTTTTTTSYTSTAYAACQTNNFADFATVRGDTCYLYNGAFQNNANLMGIDESVVINSAYDCCVFAVTDPHNAQIWLYQPNSYRDNDGNLKNICGVYVTDGTCPAQNTYQFTVGCRFEQPLGGDGEPAELTFGNGYCGEVNSLIAPNAPSSSSSSSAPAPTL